MKGCDYIFQLPLRNLLCDVEDAHDDYRFHQDECPRDESYGE